MSRDTRWPGFFIVGAEKAGTTTLDAWLRHHPDVAMPRIKEPNFFRAPEWPPDIEAMRGYESLFPGRGVRGEASPSYMADDRVPGRIASVQPMARIIAALRDPVERAFSAHLHRGRNRPQPPFEALIGKAEAAGVDAVPVLRTSLYADALDRYQDAFPKALLVIETAHLQSRPEAVWAQLCRHIGVADIPLGESVLKQRHNVYRMPRNHLGRTVLRAQRFVAFAKRIVPQGTLERLGRGVLWDDEKPTLDAGLAARCRRLFEEDVRRTEEVVGRRLPSLHGDS